MTEWEATPGSTNRMIKSTAINWSTGYIRVNSSVPLIQQAQFFSIPSRHDRQALADLNK
jgi:hypothetical protein